MAGVAAPTDGVERARLQIGGQLLSRNGETKGGPTPNATYSGQPFSRGVELAAESYPLSESFSDTWPGSLGVYGEVGWLKAETKIDEPFVHKTIHTNAWHAGGALAFRLRFLDRANPGIATFQLGFTRSEFPLRDGGFPAINYRGPYLSGACAIPFWGPLSAVGALRVMPRVSVDDVVIARTSLSGNAGMGPLRLQAGARATAGMLDLTLTLSFEYMHAGFKSAGGTTNVSDRTLGGQLSAGMTF